MTLPNLFRGAIALGLLGAACVQAAPQVDVIARGLSNPRGLGFAPNGQLFVAEARPARARRCG